MIVPGSGFLVGPTSASDPYWGNVVLLMHMEPKYSLIASNCVHGALTDQYAYYNPAETTNSSWSRFFEETADVGLFYYKHSPSAAWDSGVLPTKTIPIDISRGFFLRATNRNWIGDKCNAIFEFLDASDNVICVIKTEADTTYSSGLWYGSSTSSLTKVSRSGSYGYTNHDITFTSSGITATFIPKGDETSGYNTDFSYTVNTSSITKVRVSNMRAASNYTGGSGSAWVILSYKQYIDEKKHNLTVFTHWSSIATGRFGSAPVLSASTISDRIVVTDASDLDLSGDFTIEMWIKPAVLGEARTAFSTITSYAHSWNSNMSFNTSIDNRYFFNVYSSSGAMQTITTATNAVDTNWHHFALVRSGSTVRGYMDGVVFGSSITFSDVIAPQGITIGSSYEPNGSRWKGSIDEIRITKGVARYTSNFTPPSEPFPNS